MNGGRHTPELLSSSVFAEDEDGGSRGKKREDAAAEDRLEPFEAV